MPNVEMLRARANGLRYGGYATNDLLVWAAGEIDRLGDLVKQYQELGDQAGQLLQDMLSDQQ